jgi:hypothetical protein
VCVCVCVCVCMCVCACVRACVFKGEKKNREKIGWKLVNSKKQII